MLRSRILSLAWPAIAVNITTPLLSLVDVAVVGHLGNTVYIAAIALGGTMFNTLYWLFGFLRMGTSGLTAQAFGEDDQVKCTRTLARSIMIALVAAALLIAFADPIGGWLLRLVDDGDAAQAPAMRYFSVAVWGAPAVLVTYSLSGWFLGMQTSKPMLWMALIANTLNIGLNFAFVYGLSWDVAGVGAATAISQWVSAGIGILIMRRRLRTMVTAGWRRGLMRLDELRRAFTVNGDIFLRTLCLVAVTLWFTHVGAGQGVLTLSANALLMQMFMLFSYFMDGFAFAGEALCGRYHGAGDFQSLRRTVRALFAIGAFVAVIATVVYLLAGDALLAVLTDDRAVLATAHSYLPWAVAIPLAGFASFTWDGVYIGLTRTRLMLLSVLVSATMFFVIYFALFPTLHNHALWLAFITWLAVRGLMQTALYAFCVKPQNARIIKNGSM